MVLRPRTLWIAPGSAFLLAAFYFGLKLHMWQCPQCKRRFSTKIPSQVGCLGPRILPRSAVSTVATFVVRTESRSCKLTFSPT